MSITELIILLIIAAICGAIGQALGGYTTGGCLLSIIVGIAGAYLGIWLARQLNLPVLLPLTVGDTTVPIIWSIIGATIFSAILGFLRRALAGDRDI